MQSTGWPVRSLGKSVSPTAGRFRIRRWRLGMAGMRIWRPAKAPSAAVPVATVQRASGNTRIRWSWSRQVLLIHRIAGTGATTSADHRLIRTTIPPLEAFDDTESRDQDGKYSVQ